MSENNKIKDIFEKVLGTNIEIENIKIEKSSDKEFFINFISVFESINDADNDVYDMFSIDLTSIISPYHTLIESLLLMIYDAQITELILWYIYERKNEDGTINTIQDESGNEYTLKNSKDLWSFIKRFKLDNEI